MRSAILLVVLLIPGPAVAGQEPGTEAYATVDELMIGIIDPSTNIVGTAAFIDPAAPPEDSFTQSRGWLDVESAAAAMVESATLLRFPGRSCSNGQPAPYDAADWVQWTEDLRAAGRATYEAASRQSMEELLDLSEQLTASCAACHGKYLDTGSEGAMSCAP